MRSLGSPCDICFYLAQWFSIRDNLCPSGDVWQCQVVALVVTAGTVWLLLALAYRTQLSLFFISCQVVSGSFQHHELHQARLPCPSPSPGVCSDSCPLSQWCHPTTSFSVNPRMLLNIPQYTGQHPLPNTIASKCWRCQDWKALISLKLLLCWLLL